MAGAHAGSLCACLASSPLVCSQDGSRSTERVKPYADAAVAVARDLGLPFVDLFNKIQVG
jgi:hypothetical protein